MIIIQRASDVTYGQQPAKTHRLLVLIEGNIMGDTLKKTSSSLTSKGKSKGKAKKKVAKKVTKVEKEVPVVIQKVAKSKGWTITRDLIVRGKVGVRVACFAVAAVP